MTHITNYFQRSAKISIWLPLLVGWTSSFGNVNAEQATIPLSLAKKNELILDDIGSVDRGKASVALNHMAKVRAGAGQWHRVSASSGRWRSTWHPGSGHAPVVSYHGFHTTNLIVEVTFRYGDITESWQHQCFRIAADQRPKITGHVVSAWANANNDFIETGFLLQHIRKTPEKVIIEDLLLDHQPLKVQPRVWYTAMLEIVDDEALFRMADHLAYAKADQFRTSKNLVSLTLGTTWHEIRRVRIWHASPNPDWPKVKESLLSRRSPFDPVIHEFKKSASLE